MIRQELLRRGYNATVGNLEVDFVSAKVDDNHDMQWTKSLLREKMRRRDCRFCKRPQLIMKSLY